MNPMFAAWLISDEPGVTNKSSADWKICLNKLGRQTRDPEVLLHHDDVVM